MGTKAVDGSSLHILDDVGALGEVDEGGGAHALAHDLLVVTSINRDGVDTHSLCVLQGKGTETTTGTDNGDGLTSAHASLLETLVDGDTGAQDGGNGGEIAALGYPCNVGSLGDGVLLEGTVDRVAGEEGLRAEGLVGLLAEVAGKAGAVQPLRQLLEKNWRVKEGSRADLDADLVANLDVLDERTGLDNGTSTLVATDKGNLDGQGPVALHGVEVGVADTGVLDVDEDLIGTGLLDIDLLVDRALADGLDDLGHLLLGNLGSRHGDDVRG